MTSFKFKVVLCRIRPFPTLISKIKWLWSGLPLKIQEIHSNFWFQLIKLITTNWSLHIDYHYEVVFWSKTINRSRNGACCVDGVCLSRKNRRKNKIGFKNQVAEHVIGSKLWDHVTIQIQQFTRIHHMQSDAISYNQLQSVLVNKISC